MPEDLSMGRDTYLVFIRALLGVIMVAGVLIFDFVIFHALSAPAGAQEVKYCKHGQTGQVIVIEAGFACPFGYYAL